MRRLTQALYVLYAITCVTVAFFGSVEGEHAIAWGISSGLFIAGAFAALYSIFTRENFSSRVGLMAAPFLMRGVLYATTPESLPEHNEWAASSINILVGVMIILFEARNVD